MALVLKLMIPNLNLIPDLIAVMLFPRNVILTNLFRIFSTSEVICHMGPFHPSQKEKNNPHNKKKTKTKTKTKTLPFAPKRCPGLKISFSFFAITSLAPFLFL